MTVWGIVVAGGTGSRFGRLKQYEPLGDRRVLDWAVRSARSVAAGVVLAVPPERADQTEDGVDVVVAGGRTRSGSVRAALRAVPPEAEVIVVHDAARPLAQPSLFRSVVQALAGGADAAVPALAVPDTLKQVSASVVSATLPRENVVAVQTPQAFRAEVLRRAHAGAPDATDDAGLVEAVGGRVVVVPGDPRNSKVTSEDDLARIRELAGVAVQMPAGAARTLARTGIGFDVHALSQDPNRRLVLAGVELAGALGLAGHSDADVVAHAVADALLGAAGQGDLGRHFPDTDPAWAGVDSLRLLALVVDLIGAAGWAPVNVDCSVVAEAPRLAPHIAAMQERLTATIGADVSVKATRAEGLGALGRGEGIACWAVALVERR